MKTNVLRWIIYWFSIQTFNLDTNIKQEVFKLVKPNICTLFTINHVYTDKIISPRNSNKTIQICLASVFSPQGVYYSSLQTHKMWSCGGVPPHLKCSWPIPQTARYVHISVIIATLCQLTCSLVYENNKLSALMICVTSHGNKTTCQTLLTFTMLECSRITNLQLITTTYNTS